MRKTTIFLSIILICVLIYGMVTDSPNGHTVEIMKQGLGISELPFTNGERFTYEVRYNELNIGRAVLTFNGEAEIDGRKVYAVTLSTAVPSLKDAEDLYAHKDTFLPLEVHRTIKKRVGFDDRIVEKYDQENFRVDIFSKSKLRSKKFSIQKDSPIHNAILLSYSYRLKKGFDKNEKLKVNLPTLSLEVMFSGIETVKTPLGEYEAYVFTSEPPKFKLWLSADEKKIPLKIKNPGTLGYSLVIKSID